MVLLISRWRRQHEEDEAGGAAKKKKKYLIFSSCDSNSPTGLLLICAAASDHLSALMCITAINTSAFWDGVRPTSLSCRRFRVAGDEKRLQERGFGEALWHNDIV